MNAPTAIFTIVSANYIAFAATLMQSVRKFHPELSRFIILSDAMHRFEGLDTAAEVIACDDLGIPLIANMKLWYSVIEFNTAVKPFTFEHLFNTRGFESAIYLDPDIELYAPLAAVLDGLQAHSLVLTPHIMEPLQDGKRPDDLAIMKSGVYNLGFAAIRNDTDGRKLLRWWSERLYRDCRVDIAANLFTDQRWMDLAPCFVNAVLILRHPGYNAAYWNVAHRQITRGPDGEWLCNGVPLVFYHFSGIKPEDGSVFSKHQDRFTADTLGQLGALCDEYRARVLANGWLTFNKTPYAFAHFGDGWPILDTMRRCVARLADEGALPPGQPIRIGSAFFDQAEERSFAGGGKLTRFAYQFWLDRSDLRAAFALDRPDGFAAYVAWFCDGPAKDEGATARTVQALRALQAGGASLQALPEFVAPPWPSIAAQAWEGPASAAGAFLSGEIAFSLGGAKVWIDRQSALLWERRTDLQRAFPNRNLSGIEQYHVWCLTRGIREGAIDAASFSPRYLGWLDSPSPIARLYGELPITQAMALTRHVSDARDGLSSWREFPLDEAARLEQAFWFTFVAPKLFDWPPSVTASVRSWMDQPTNIEFDGFAFTRGLLALHRIRSDVRETFDLSHEADRWAYLCWVLVKGAREMAYDVSELAASAAPFLRQPSPRLPQLTRLADLVYDSRDDVRRAFDLTQPEGVAGFEAWTRSDMPAWLEEIGLHRLLDPPGSTPAEAGPARKVQIVLAGDWTVPSGVGEDLRQLVAALDLVGFRDYLVLDLRSNRLHAPGGDALEGETSVHAALLVVVHNAETAVDDWRALRALHVSADRTVGRWFWELERIPRRWRHAFSFVDEVWAASAFVQSTFQAEKLRPVRLLPSCVARPKRPDGITRAQFGLSDDSTLFLFMFDFASYANRKNPVGVVQAFKRAFPNGTEPVQLVLKTQNAAMRPDLWSELISVSADPRIVIKDSRLSRQELTGLIATANALVSLHRSEGFGYVPAEAMLLGVPVIVTGYSGTADFTDESCACIVPYSLVPVGKDEYPGVEGQRWAEPDLDTAAHLMRWVHECPAEARALGERGRRHAEAHLDPRRIGDTLLVLAGSQTSDTAAQTQLRKRRVSRRVGS